MMLASCWNKENLDVLRQKYILVVVTQQQKLLVIRFL